jgi:hypothetical protein
MEITALSGSDFDGIQQYVESEAAAAWTEHFQGRRAVKHYSIRFLSENFRLEIFAGDFLIS